MVTILRISYAFYNIIVFYKIINIINIKKNKNKKQNILLSLSQTHFFY